MTDINSINSIEAFRSFLRSPLNNEAVEILTRTFVKINEDNIFYVVDNDPRCIKAVDRFLARFHDNTSAIQTRLFSDEKIIYTIPYSENLPNLHSALQTTHVLRTALNEANNSINEITGTNRSSPDVTEIRLLLQTHKFYAHVITDEDYEAICGTLGNMGVSKVYVVPAGIADKEDLSIIAFNDIDSANIFVEASYLAFSLDKSKTLSRAV